VLAAAIPFRNKAAAVGLVEIAAHGARL
jgi:hypothetical protein